MFGKKTEISYRIILDDQTSREQSREFRAPISVASLFSTFAALFAARTARSSDFINNKSLNQSLLETTDIDGDDDNGTVASGFRRR